MAVVQKIKHPEISEIFVLPTKEEAARYSAELIAGEVNKNPFSRVTFATGNTQVPVYSSLARMHENGEVDFPNIFAFHLDEYYPCKPTEKFGFVNYLYNHVFRPLEIPEEHIFTINGLATDANIEAERYEALLHEASIDLTILGIGPGGHIAFCEAGTPFTSRTQLIELSNETVHRDRVERGQNTPQQAITQGIATILSSKKIILNAFDAWHGGVMKEVLYKTISEQIPGTSLRTAGDKVTIVLDQEAADALV